MPTLLHLDASPRTDKSVSRRLTAEFVRHWQAANPDGQVLRRDLATDPLPHVDAGETGLLYRMGQPLEPKPAQVALAEELIAELMSVDVLLIGSPMYNFTITSGLKAYFDHVVWPGLTIDPAKGAGTVTRPAAVVVATRSGGYSPGSPREAFNFHDPYLTALLGFIGITEVEIVPAELTLFTGPDAMASPPGMPDLRELGERSMTDAEHRLLTLATHGGRTAPNPAAEWSAPQPA